MRCSLAAFAIPFLLLAAAPAGAETPAAFPKADAFEPGSGRLWFSACVYESERYITCKSAQPSVLDAISNPGDQTPGGALQMHVSDVFIEKGCAFEAAPDSFRVNGVFLSFDTKAAKDIRCKGKSASLGFSPEGIVLLDTLYFFTEDAPQ
jgi:hypothetical protein